MVRHGNRTMNHGDDQRESADHYHQHKQYKEPAGLVMGADFIGHLLTSLSRWKQRPWLRTESCALAKNYRIRLIRSVSQSAFALDAVRRPAVV